MRERDYEENGEKVERGVAGMLQVVGVPDESLVGSVDVGLARILHSGQGEEIGEATNEEEPNAGQEKPGFIVEDHPFHKKGRGSVSVLAMFEMCRTQGGPFSSLTCLICSSQNSHSQTGLATVPMRPFLLTDSPPTLAPLSGLLSL